MTRAVCVMVLGTTSGAGKSWLATALCRHYARLGYKVAPFKAQNMSNNARVVAGPAPSGAALTQVETMGDVTLRVSSVGAERVTAGPPQGETAPSGGSDPRQRWSVGAEIGSAQYFQAIAARAEPDVRMNPLLLKPEADTRSQVVLMGQVNHTLSAMPWRGRSEHVWPAIAAALDSLRADNDVVVIEGAGSPAEINLHASDIVNMRVARHAQARCLLVTDIDRGGAFAHLYGTWALLQPAERALIHGFVLNKFRGDASLLAPGPQMLQELTGVPTVATLPMWWKHGLPEEDGVFDDRSTGGAGAPAAPGESLGVTTIAVIAYPRISNLDEFQPLKNVPGVRLVWARSPADCVGANWIVLPGSKATSADLAWLRAQGLDRTVAAHAEQGGAVLGICGGLQMLGEALVDPHGIDGNAPGLGLLPIVTQFAFEKTVRRTSGVLHTQPGPWGALNGVVVKGYEIRHGQTQAHLAMAQAGQRAHEVLPELAWQGGARGQVLGLYLHGLFEDASALQALFGSAVPTLDSVCDGLADFVQQHFQPGVLSALVENSSL